MLYFHFDPSPITFHVFSLVIAFISLILFTLLGKHSTQLPSQKASAPLVVTSAITSLLSPSASPTQSCARWKSSCWDGRGAVICDESRRKRLKGGEPDICAL